MRIEKFEIISKEVNDPSNPTAFEIVTRVVLKIDKLKFEINLEKSAIQEMSAITQDYQNGFKNQPFKLHYIDGLFHKDDFIETNKEYLGGINSSLFSKMIPYFLFYHLKISSGQKVLFDGPMLNGYQDVNYFQQHFDEKNFIKYSFQRLKPLHEEKGIRNKDVWIDHLCRHILLDQSLTGAKFNVNYIISNLISAKNNKTNEDIQIRYPLDVYRFISIYYRVSNFKEESRIFESISYKLVNKENKVAINENNETPAYLSNTSLSTELRFFSQHHHSMEEIVKRLS